MTISLLQGDTLLRMVRDWIPQSCASLFELDQKRLLKSIAKNRISVSVFSAQEKNKRLGLLICQYNNFDSQTFNVRVNNVELIGSKGSFNQQVRTFFQLLQYLIKQTAKKPAYFVCRTLPQSLPAIRALEDNGFRYLSAMVDMTADRFRQFAPKKKRKIMVSPYTKGDLLALKAMAGRVFRYSRFHSDETFSKIDADKFHQKWIENACEHGFANLVLVARQNQTPMGFHVLKVDPDGAVRTSLIAVERHYEGQGIGQSLIEAGYQSFPKATKFRVRTEASNLQAIRLYQKCGFALDYVSLYYRCRLK